MHSQDPRKPPAAPRPYIGVHFECCGVYARVYRRPNERLYTCRCPRCLRTAVVRVGAGGCNERFFRVR
jgi:hypothetical protein